MQRFHSSAGGFRRAAGLVLLLAFVGCKSPEHASIQPLPEDGPPLSYSDLAWRVKDQSLAAQEFFYRDSWDEVQQAARALQDSATRLKNMKPETAPEKTRPALAKHSEELFKIASDLHAAGTAKDVNRTNEVFQRLNLKVRDLRAE